ncbi:MAG: ammonium transporter [Synergistetes bacterium]|nr:ammonium transporter [Synergistota bacterium]MCX8128012.1 ammonium transporter [Synergistota bacterium]MDW8192793.1 ammonium transporter [Synergistota bacterium]
MNMVFGECISYAKDPTGLETLRGNSVMPVDYVWILVCAFLVMFMQTGFAMLEAGFCRAKNVTNLIAKNLIDFVLGSLIFFAFGYALMMGDDWYGLIGIKGWFMLGDYYDVSKYLNMFWMLVFCATAATIVSGAVAERLKFSAYLIYTIVVSSIIYPIYGHWVWGGGWLSKLPFGLGVLDFAGSGVVHALGGLVGLAGTIVLGPRYGKYKNGVPQAIPGHSVSLAALGVFILWFGWFGFNPGSTYSAHHLRISVIAVNTNLAAAAGGLAALIVSYLKTKKWDITMALNGVIAGLVAITAPCAWVEGWASVLIGIIAGVLMYASVKCLDNWGIDDPVGAVSVHGVCGLWGFLSVGIFADGTYGVYSIEPPYVTGLLYGGWGQLLSQLIGAVVLFVWAFGMGYVLFKLMDKAFGIRVSPEEELKGLDVYEHGIPAYPDFYSRV